MSPMIASARENKPPAPTPWMPRKAASSYIDRDSPHSAEPTMKMPMAPSMNALRPYRSDSLPYSGVEIVEVMRKAVVAHAWREKPCRSSAIVRMAVDMIVWSSAARNMPISRPTRMVTICRWLRPPPTG